MLRITVRTNADNAKAYFDKALAREDYYLDEATTGQWHGRIQNWLRLPDMITRESFHALCDNRNPSTMKSLTPRTNTNRRVGYDFTFSAPKSVSVLHALTKDERLTTAFSEAVTEAMTSIETEMKTRVRRGGQEEDRTTGNLLWGQFTHYTARPVDGVPDPHLHAHCFAMNLTYDEVEGRFKAGQFGDLKRDAPYFQAVFNNMLARRLKSLGYGIERTAHGFTLSGVDDTLIRKFSRRTALIEETAKRNLIHDPKAKATLGSRTREAKQEHLSMATLEHHWMSRLDTQELMSLAELRDQPVTPTVSAQEAIHHSMSSALERSSVVAERRVLTGALAYGVGQMDEESLTQAVQTSEYVKFTVDDTPVYTTRKVLREEQSLIAFAKQRRNTCTPIRSDAKQYQCTADYLNDGQRGAVHHILSSPDQIIGIRGAAGTGKTTMMTEAVTAIEQSGQSVFVFAPSAQAARKVLREEGFDQAETVAQLLNNPSLQEQITNQVIWIDEAGLLGTQAMSQVFALADKHQARVILSGDYGQHSSVPRGDALRILEDHGGMTLYRLSKIMRQKEARYRDAVASIASGKLAYGTQQLDALGAIQEVDGEERYHCIAEDYVNTVTQTKGRRQNMTAMVVSPTHHEGRLVTTEIRRALQAQGILSEREVQVTHLHSTGQTDAEKKDHSQYQPGTVIEFIQNAPGITKGARFSVIKSTPTHLDVIHPDGTQATLPFSLADRYQVYTPHTLRVAPGEKILITKNGQTKDRKHRLHNGSIYTVSDITPEGDLVLSNGWVVAQSFGHLTHGYCTTSHKAQGRSVDKVIIAQSTLSVRATTSQQWYVSVSRGKSSVSIYTDDKAELMRSIERDGRRLSATEAHKRDARSPELRHQKHIHTTKKQSRHHEQEYGYEREREL